MLTFKGRIHNGGGANGTKLNDNGGELYASIKADETSTKIITFDSAEDKLVEGEYTVPDGISEITIFFTKNKDIAYIDNVSLSKKE